MADTTQPAGALPEDFGIPTAYRRQSRHYANALMTERDALRQEAKYWEALFRRCGETRVAAIEEAAALRRELEELRAQKPVANVINADEEETVDLGFVDWIGRVALKSGTKLYARPIPPDAREGREPLTEEQIIRITAEMDCDRPGWAIRWARAIEAAHGIGPAGTSADGDA